MADQIASDLTGAESFGRPNEAGIEASEAEFGEPRAEFPWRAFLIGLVGIPIAVYWIEVTEIVVRGADLAAMSLIMAAVALLLVLVAVNQIVRFFARKYALTQSELLLIYGMNAATVGIAGLGMMQFLVTQLAAPFYYSTPSNHWDSWTHYLRAWAYPNPSVVKDFYNGRTSLLASGHLAGWLSPIIVWTTFTFVLMLAFYCLCTLLRRQWVERERLLFPIVAIPLEITQNGGASPLFRSKAFWLGSAVAIVMELLATLHYTVSPSIPYIPIKPSEPAYQIDQYLTSVPWNGIGSVQLAIYPMVIGLAYLLSLDVSFSVWFFYGVVKAENVLSTALGYHDPGAPFTVARIPYQNEQCAGAFTALALISLWHAMPHLKRAWRHAFSADDRAANPSYTDKNEPMTYMAAYIGLIGSAIFLIAFGVALGMSLAISILFIALFLLWAITMSRIRAEAGLPWYFGPGNSVHFTIAQTGGPANFTPQQLTAFSTMTWFDQDYRTMVMPQQFEVMKIADEGSGGHRLINARHMTVCILIGTVVAILASWWSLLSIYYHYGAASASVEPWRTSMGPADFNQLKAWLDNPTPFDSSAMKWMIGAAAFTVFLSVMRTRFVWWPFFPIGYAVSTTWFDNLWFPILVGWVVKRTILRYGGLQLYRRVLPFFMGLIIGDYAISSLLAAIYGLLGQSGYRTFPN